MLFSKDETRHYCLIRDLDRLLDCISKYGHRMHHCVYCLHGFVRQDLLEAHEPRCSKHGPQKIRLPGEDHTTLSYSDVQKQLRAPFIIYAEFESLLINCDTTELDPSMSFTQKTQQHKPSGFCYTVVSTL